MDRFISTEGFEITRGGRFFGWNKSNHRHFSILNQIGSKSSYGSIMNLKNLNRSNATRYVLKFMPFKSTRDKYIFRNEVHVGSSPRLWQNKIGPTVYASLETKDFGMYIMNNLEYWDSSSSLKLMTLHSYMKTYHNSKPPPVNSTVLTLLRRNLIGFYNITKGYHGDLHTLNIGVVVSTGTRPRVFNVFIYDYGSHTPFKYPANIANKSLNNLFNHIAYEFYENYYEAPVSDQNVFHGARTLHANKKQPRRMNSEALGDNLSNALSSSE